MTGPPYFTKVHFLYSSTRVSPFDDYLTADAALPRVSLLLFISLSLSLFVYTYLLHDARDCSTFPNAASTRIICTLFFLRFYRSHGKPIGTTKDNNNDDDYDDDDLHDDDTITRPCRFQALHTPQ